MTSLGYSFVTAPAAVDVSSGNFFWDATNMLLTVANVDNNFLNVFPVSTNFTEYQAGPSIAKIDVYGGDAQLAGVLWIEMNSEASPTIGVTTYTIVDYVVRSAQAWDPYNVFFLSVNFGRSTAPVAPLGIASVGGSGTDQAFSSSTPQVVEMGTVLVPSTNTSDVTATNSNENLTVMVTGVFNVSGSVTWVASPLEVGVYALVLRVNGTPVRSVNSAASDSAITTLTQSISVLLSLTANDVVDLTVIAPNADPTSISRSGTTVPWLTVERRA